MNTRHSILIYPVVLSLLSLVGVVGPTQHGRDSHSPRQPGTARSSAPSPPAPEWPEQPPVTAVASPLATAPRGPVSAETATPSKEDLAARVSELTRQASHLQESFGALGRKRQVALSNHDESAASRLLDSMMAVAAKRRETSIALIEAGFDLSCVRVNECDEATRDAFLSSRK